MWNYILSHTCNDRYWVRRLQDTAAWAFLGKHNCQQARVNVNVKWSLYRPGVAQRVGRGIALLFHDCSTTRGWVVSSTPSHTLPPGKNWYPFYRRLGGPQGRSGWAENLVPTGIQSRTTWPVVSRYTDWATQPTISKGTTPQCKRVGHNNSPAYRWNCNTQICEQGRPAEYHTKP